MQTQSADDETVSFAIHCSEQISLATANVRLRDQLRDQSTKDPLTGLFNRRYFLECCREAFADAERNAGCAGLISFDVDNFKKFNDNHGHDAGDTVLRSISEIMVGVCQRIGTPCRYGGEEFTAVFPGLELEQLREIAEDFRKQVNNLSVRYGDSILPKTSISIGLATYPLFGANPQEVLNAADRALYEAKDMGKNCVVVASK